MMEKYLIEKINVNMEKDIAEFILDDGFIFYFTNDEFLFMLDDQTFLDDTTWYQIHEQVNGLFLLTGNFNELVGEK